MKKILTTIITLLLCAVTELQAQKITVSGIVVDDKTGQEIAHANVAVSGTNIAVVTNDDGFFTLKLDDSQAELVASHLGYRSHHFIAAQAKEKTIKIRLKPSMVQLHEVVVWTGNPRELVNIAIRKIPQNYSRQPELYNCFYREAAMKRNHFIYVAEGVVDMYKTAYGRSTSRDRVAIRKGRRLLSPKQNDTLSVKVMGGPVQPIQLDIVKNLDFLLNAEELDNYYFQLELPEAIDNRSQYVVSITPKAIKPYALYIGKFYIDRETLAFTRAELSLDMSDRDKASYTMLVRKPAGVRFRPKELSSLIDYRYENGVTHISYIRSTFRFNCDWKRRLFATSFTAFCEMVVTDKQEGDVEPIAGRSSFDSRDSFYDKVDYFRDPNFWENYNIIEPTETLDQAIGKLVKKYN